MSSNPFESPQQPGGPYQPPGTIQGDATGGVIPYKNPYALTAYYVGIFSLLCCITPLPLGIVPIVLGIIGLRQRARNPVIKGSVHAWIGIVLGALSTLGSLTIGLGVLVSLLAR